MLPLYENIRKLRLEKGMSQQELAELVGYASGKSMIAKIESGHVDLTQTKIKQFAEALKTTPSDLMGWDNQAELSTGNADFLGSLLFDKELMEYCQKLQNLSDRDRKIVFSLIQSLSST